MYRWIANAYYPVTTFWNKVMAYFIDLTSLASGYLSFVHKFQSLFGKVPANHGNFYLLFCHDVPPLSIPLGCVKYADELLCFFYCKFYLIKNRIPLRPNLLGQKECFCRRCIRNTNLGRCDRSTNRLQ